MVLKLALVGYGYWGPNLARNFSKLPDAEVHYVVDSDEKKRERAKKEYPHAHTSASLEQVLSKVDAVLIATPPKTHFALAKLALEAGKHILVEKPVTTTAKEARELEALAKEKNRIAMIDYTFIYVDHVRYIKKLLDSGEMGKIASFYFQRQGIDFLRRDVNVVDDLLPHDLSMLVYWMGEKATRAKTVLAAGKSHFITEIEDEAISYLDFGDFTASMLVSCLSPVKVRKVLIIGDKKMVEFDDTKLSDKVAVHDKEIRAPLEAPTSYWDFLVKCRRGSTTLPYVPSREPLANMAAHFVDCVKNKKKPDTDISFGVIVTELMERINNTVRKGRG
ncbi:gfo/Idh/MocA family oxidoreductase [Candidatus Micrarchaeota archaeon]|nr:MAG: gfo/Idh/MocA family oxidoreductase [Candidatus Micrarchaeota archaeon]